MLGDLEVANLTPAQLSFFFSLSIHIRSGFGKSGERPAEF